MSEEYRSPESYTEKEKWALMNGPQRIQYIWDYYKLPIVIACIVLYIIGYSIFRAATHKDTVLYAALVNVSAGDALIDQLSDGYLETLEVDPAKNKVELYTDWYLTNDTSSQFYQFSYATNVKILASLTDHWLDVVLMNQEAFDAFAQNGYLGNIDELLAEADPALHEALQPYFVNNFEILSDNQEEVALDPSVEYVSETSEYPMAVELSAAPFIQEAGFDAAVYFGIIANTPRLDRSIDYLRYLFS